MAEREQGRGEGEESVMCGGVSMVVAAGGAGGGGGAGSVVHGACRPWWCWREGQTNNNIKQQLFAK